MSNFKRMFVNLTEELRILKPKEMKTAKFAKAAVKKSEGMRDIAFSSRLGRNVTPSDVLAGKKKPMSKDGEKIFRQRLENYISKQFGGANIASQSVDQLNSDDLNVILQAIQKEMQ